MVPGIFPPAAYAAAIEASLNVAECPASADVRWEEAATTRPPHFPDPNADPIAILETRITEQDEIIANLHREAKAWQAQAEAALARLNATEANCIRDEARRDMTGKEGRPGADETAITDEMIAVGVCEAREHALGESLETLVWRIYVAMTAESHRSVSASLMSVDK